MRTTILAALTVLCVACVPPTDPNAPGATTGAGAGAAAAPAPTAGGDVLAEKDGVTLRRAHAQVIIEVLQFVVGGAITEAEGQEIARGMVADFEANPAKTVSDAEALAQTWTQVRQVTNPIQIAMLRQAFIAAFHQGAQSLGGQNLPPFIQVMYRHIRVVGYDPANQLVLTDRDVDALIAYATFMYQLQGGAVPAWSPEQREQVIAAIGQAFPSFTVDQKRFYCSMTVYWNYVVYAWAQAAAQERQRMAMALLNAQMGAAAQPQPAQNWGTMQPQRQVYAQPGGGQMDDHTYDVLRNVMLEQHAASMNVLDTIGGKEYNYDVVDEY